MKTILCLLLSLIPIFLNAEIKILHPLTFPTEPFYNNGIIRVRATVVNGFGPFELELFKENQYTGKKFTNVNGEIEFINLEPGMYSIDVRVVGNPCKTTLYAELISCQQINIHNVELVHHFCYETQNAPLRFFFDQGSPNCLIKVISEKQNVLATKTGGPGQHDILLNFPPTGLHKIVIWDPISSCTESEPFELKAMPNLISIRSNTYSRTCYNKGNIIISMWPNNRKFHYQWSDGYQTHENDMTQREINLGQSYHLTVTDELTHCEKSFSNVFEARTLPYFPVNIKSYKDASGPNKNDGEVDIWLYGNQDMILWNAKIITYRNGNMYPDASFTFSRTYQLKVPKLLPGIYQFKIEDAKGCEVVTLEHEIYSCPVKPESLIKIFSYSLPPSTPGAYIKASPYYSGDLSKCKYHWFIYNNPFYYKITTTPELNTNEINQLTWSDHDRICVRMLCPCTTEANDCVKYNPCNNNNIVFRKKELTNVCFGTLPTGKFINHREFGSIHLEIDVTKLQFGYTIGKVEFDYYIHDVRWSDGAPAFFTYNKSNQTLYVDRMVTESKTFTLIITDGLGCAHSAGLSIGNDFRFEQSHADGQDYCLFWTACRPFEEAAESEIFKHYENTIREGSAGNCALELWCGNQKIRNLSGSTSPYYDEREIFKDEEGNCFTKKICFINDASDIIVDLSLPEYEMLYYNPQETNSVKQLAFIRYAQAPCCEPDNYTSFQIESALYHVNFINDGPYNDVVMNSDNPCKAILFCPENSLYIKYLTGNIVEEKYCRINALTCYRCVRCNFQINGVNYTATTFNHKLSVCGEVDSDLCNGGTECLQNEGGGQNGFLVPLNVLNFSRLSQIQTFLDINYNTNEEPISFHVYNVLGNCLMRYIKFSIPQYNLIKSDLDALTDGIYFITIHSASGYKTIKWVKH